MASLPSVTLTANMQDGTVIRIKRKRSVDPLSNLFIQQCSPKKQKVEENCLFRLAGTVASSEVKTTKNIVEEFKNKLASPKKTKLQDIKEKLRKDTRESQQSSRYRIVAKLRQNGSTNANDISTGEENIQYNVYDIEEANDRKINSNSNHIPTTDELLCNSVKMIRENLKIYDETPKDPEYVYDIYFAENSIIVQDEEYLEIAEYFEELVNEYENEDVGLYEDEDDENDEDNWRNDYPDEDEYNSSEDEHRGFGSGSSDDEISHEYRHREGNFDLYGEYNTEQYYDIEADYDDG